MLHVSNIQLHKNVLPVAKELTYTIFSQNLSHFLSLSLSLHTHIYICIYIYTFMSLPFRVSSVGVLSVLKHFVVLITVPVSWRHHVDTHARLVDTRSVYQQECLKQVRRFCSYFNPVLLHVMIRTILNHLARDFDENSKKYLLVISVSAIFEVILNPFKSKLLENLKKCFLDTTCIAVFLAYSYIIISRSL